MTQKYEKIQPVVLDETTGCINLKTGYEMNQGRF